MNAGLAPLKNAKTILLTTYKRDGTAVLAAATGGETLGGDPRPLLTPPPDDLACRDLVRLVSDYLDGDLPSGWRASIDDHLKDCDGCTSYLEQIRQTVALLEQIDAIQHPAPTKASGTAEQPGTGKGFGLDAPYPGGAVEAGAGP